MAGVDVGAAADDDGVGDAAGDLVSAQALVAGDGMHAGPHVADGLPGDDGAAAAVGCAARALQGEALGRVPMLMVRSVSGEVVQWRGGESPVVRSVAEGGGEMNGR